ncbi:MAG: N-acetylmuramoyl-L-alanine amidase [Rubrivivax sp.]
MFTVTQHRLAPPVQQQPSPNFNAGRIIVPRFLVFHYTVIDFDTTLRAFGRSGGNSAHLVVARDGRVAQCVDFNRRAWHAGESRWQTWTDLNTHSIGIEVENLGWLQRRADGRFVSTTDVPVDAADVVEARHKNPGHPHRWWQAYSQPQLDACAELAAVLCAEYGLVEVLGHDDIAPTRKADPGPAFPLTRMIAAGLGRNDPGAEPPAAGALMRVVPTFLNLRSGPSKDNAKVGAPLPQDTWVRRLGLQGDWAQVRIEGPTPREGFVWAAFLAPYAP